MIIYQLTIGIKDIGFIKTILIQKLGQFFCLFVGKILAMAYLNQGNGLLR
jgi:hypothetical protein